MEQIRCIKLNRHFYADDVKNVSPQMVALATFLMGDFISFGKYFKEWIITDSLGTGGNISYLDREGDTIVLSFIPAIVESDVIFQTSRDRFLNIMITWEKLYRAGWNEIIITLDGEEVTMEGMMK
jgi:hypothetical protein